MKKQKQNTAITLVALIITVIILLILAGVSINFLFGNEGIFSKTQYAVEQYKNAQNAEQAMLNEVTNYITDGYMVGNRETNVTTKTVKDGDKTANVPIPEGFFYVGGDIDTGVIISDNKDDANKSNEWTQANDSNGLKAHNAATELKGNQFVWIPCTIDEYKKIDTFKTNTNDSTWGYNAWNSRWDKHTNSAEEIQIKKYGGFYIGRYEAGVGDIFAESAGLKASSVTASTNSYGWGWQNTSFTYNNITRGKKIVEKANEIPYFHADYTTAINLSKEMYDTTSVYSGLVTGTMWDMVMKYISTTSDYSDLKSTEWGNFQNTALTGIRGKISVVTTGGVTGAWTAADGTGTTSNTTANYYLLTTGSTNTVQKKHIYDLAGNLLEWTDEAAYFDVGSSYTTNTDYNGYMNRGGSFTNSYSAFPAAFRDHNSAASTTTNYGFRPALFIK